MSPDDNPKPPTSWAEKLIQFLVERTQVLAAMVVVVFVVFGFLAYGVIAGTVRSTEQNHRIEQIINANEREATQQREHLQKVAQCIFDQLLQQRVASRQSHEVIGRALGVEVPPSQELPREPSEGDIAKSCINFYPKPGG